MKGFAYTDQTFAEEQRYRVPACSTAGFVVGVGVLATQKPTPTLQAPVGGVVPRPIPALPSNAERPFRYVASRSYEEVSGRLLTDLVSRVFRGSREQLLLRLLERRELTQQERTVLESILREEQP